jgi:hypothetical protein
MPAVHHLIDCEGRSLRAPFRVLRQALGDGVAEHALLAHAVEKFGYLHVQEWPRGLIVSYRRPITNPLTLVGAIFLLTDLADRRVIFSVSDGYVRYFLCRGRSQAVGRLVRELRDVEEAASITRSASDDPPAGRRRVEAKRSSE